MEWNIVSKEKFYILAMQREFNEETSNSGIPEFYNEYASSTAAQTVAPRIGVCFPPEAGCDWVYAIGDECAKDSQTPPGFRIIEIPAQDWAVFICDNAKEAWNFIYGEWFLTSGYEILPDSTLEYYENGNIKQIHIPVRKMK